MKKSGHSNVFTVPSWMKNLRVQEPEGTHTPDQVASSLELCLLLNNGDLTVLQEAIATLVPKVPLKRQAVIKALLQGDVLANVQAFISEVNLKLAPLLMEQALDVEPPYPSGKSPVIGPDYIDWTQADDSVFSGKRRTRGHRAVRAAKRQSTES